MTSAPRTALGPGRRLLVALLVLLALAMGVGVASGQTRSPDPGSDPIVADDTTDRSPDRGAGGTGAGAVTARGASPEGLALTGGEILRLVLLGLALICLGVVLRRSHDPRSRPADER